MLGVLEPVWINTTESEIIIAWLSEMLDRMLVAKDIEIFVKKYFGEAKVRECTGGGDW